MCRSVMTYMRDVWGPDSASAPRFGSGPVRFEFGPGSNRTRTLDFTNFKLRTGLKLNYKFGPGSVRSLQTSLSPNMLLLNRTESNFKLSSPKFEKVRKVFLWLNPWQLTKPMTNWRNLWRIDEPMMNWQNIWRNLMSYFHTR